MVSTGLQRASCLPHFKRGKVVEAELYFHKSFCGCRDNRTLGKLVSITDFASFCIARKWSAAFILKHYLKKQLWSLVFLFSIILNTFIINSLPSWRSLLSDVFFRALYLWGDQTQNTLFTWGQLIYNCQDAPSLCLNHSRKTTTTKNYFN